MRIRKAKAASVPSAADIRDAVASAFEEGSDSFLEAVKGAWTGFKSPSGRSLAGWTVMAGESNLEISNAEDYVEFVLGGSALDEVDQAVDSQGSAFEELLDRRIGGVF